MFGDEINQSNTGKQSSSLYIRTKFKISTQDVLYYDTFEARDSEELQNEIEYYGLTYLEASLLATILEDTVMEMRILEECNNELRVTKTEVDKTLLLAIKFDVAQPTDVDELDGIDPHYLGRNDYKLNKLVADRKYLQDVVVSVYKQLTLFKTFATLQDYVNAIIKNEYDRIVLIEDEAKNKILQRELNKQLRQQRNHIKTVIYDADTTIDTLKNETEDISLKAEIRSRYVDNWQRARTEQHLQTIEDSESEPSRTVEYYKRRADYEQRVHSEVELLTTISINETLSKIDKWMDKYDRDMEGLDLKIQIKKNHYQDMLDKRIQHEKTFELHEGMMKDWIHFKEEREKARLYREKMTNSAITVQAWWRGLLVRLQLGPYKVTKKAAAAAAKKKK